MSDDGWDAEPVANTSKPVAPKGFASAPPPFAVAKSGFAGNSTSSGNAFGNSFGSANDNSSKNSFGTNSAPSNAGFGSSVAAAPAQPSSFGSTAGTSGGRSGFGSGGFGAGSSSGGGSGGLKSGGFEAAAGGFGGGSSGGNVGSGSGFGSQSGSGSAGFGGSAGFAGAPGGFGGGASAGGGGSRPCFKCGKEGHMSRECPTGGGGGPRSCHNCNEVGHMSRECPNGAGGGGGGGGPRSCHKCNEVGHFSRECPNGAGGRAATGFGSGAPTGFGSGGASTGFGSGGAGASTGFGSGGAGASTGFGSGGASTGFGSGGAGAPTGFGSGGAGASTGFGSGAAAGFGSSAPGFGNTGFGGGGQEGTGGDGCRSCGQIGHFSRECPNRNDNCFNCQQPGHRSSDCPEPRKPRDVEGDPDFKPASTFIPVELNEGELYEQRIEQGALFEKFFDTDVSVTVNGTTLDFLKCCTFAELELTPTLAANVQRAQYSKPTPVQQYAIPLVVQNYDLMACAQTGSGKTAAFLLPVMKDLLSNSNIASAAETPCFPRCIIVAPTRELAEQIYNEGRKFANGTILKVESAYGGTQVGYAKARLVGASIVVATMGRLMHFVRERLISLQKVKYVVLDEADRMLDQGFSAEIEELFTKHDMPPKEERQTLMFSATFPRDVQALAATHLKSAHALLAVDKIGAANKCITQEFIEVTDRGVKKDKLLDLLNVDVKKYTVTDREIFNQKTIVFVNRKTFADSLGINLCEAGLPCTTMHGDRVQQQRNEAINDFKSGRKPVLIATAVAERGLDIKGVDHVINYDLPDNTEDYVHRIGRTGRVGNSGRATSFFDPSNDMSIAPGLVTVLEDAEQPIPSFLQQFSGMTVTNDTGFGTSAGAAGFAGVDEDW